jgi:predicted nucleic acid-binding protein
VARLIIFDAGVLIGHLEPSDVFHHAATGFLEEFEEFDFAASVITVAECLVRPTLLGRSSEVVAKLNRLELIQLDVTAGDASRIADIRAHARLKMPDAIVLNMAEREGAELVTTDRVLASAATARGVIAHELQTEPQS